MKILSTIMKVFGAAQLEEEIEEELKQKDPANAKELVKGWCSDCNDFHGKEVYED